MLSVQISLDLGPPGVPSHVTALANLGVVPELPEASTCISSYSVLLSEPVAAHTAPMAPNAHRGLPSSPMLMPQSPWLQRSGIATPLSGGAWAHTSAWPLTGPSGPTEIQKMQQKTQRHGARWHTALAASLAAKQLKRSLEPVLSRCGLREARPRRQEGLRRTDSGRFHIPEAKPVKDNTTGQVMQYNEVLDEMADRILHYQQGKVKKLATSYLRQKGMDLLDDQVATNFDVTPLVEFTGFDQEFLEKLTREFQNLMKCGVDETIQGQKPACRVDFEAFRRTWYEPHSTVRRFFCHEGLLKRIFVVCANDSTHKNDISLQQLGYGLKYFCMQHPTAAEEVAKATQEFVDALTKLMDLESNGHISKLNMYALCDTAIGKDDVYLLCDAVWEVLTGASRSMPIPEFAEHMRQQGKVGLVLRKIFHRLMCLQCMRGGVDKYGAPFSSQAAVVKEILDITKEWRQKKKDGRFFFLDDQLRLFKEAVRSKNEEDMMHLIHKAQAFVDSLRGQDSLKAGHYVKVMFGIKERGNWNFAKEEKERVMHLLEQDKLSESQSERFKNILSVLEAFNSLE